MNSEEVRCLLEKLAGQEAPFTKSELEIEVLAGNHKELGYSQLNELLLLFGFDRICRGFFRYLLDGKTDYQPGLAFETTEQLTEGIDRFRRLAILLYGNIKFAFKSLSVNSTLLQNLLDSAQPIAPEVYQLRHSPLLDLERIQPADAYLTGYLIERQLKERLKDPNDVDAIILEVQRQETVRKALANQRAYLVSDHLDIYVATSMRERHDFVAIGKLTAEIFQSPELVDLNLRWFDPTQAYCPNRIDKGLSEGLMLRRAACTIYLAQETDTLGKDSELASTLAQGKPVVAFIPDVTDEFFASHLELVTDTSPGKAIQEVLLDQLKLYSDAAWTDSKVREWCSVPEQADAEEITARLKTSMKAHYDRRARTLRDAHPLGIQVNLQTGVANGVLVVRDVQACAKLIRAILLRNLQFDLDECADFVGLRERISDCVFRVVTKDAMLTNTFWNFYIEPAE